MQTQFTYIEVITQDDGREIVVVGMEATPENKAAMKEIFGEPIEITKLVPRE